MDPNGQPDSIVRKTFQMYSSEELHPPRAGSRETLLARATLLSFPPRPPEDRPLRRSLSVYPRAALDNWRARCHRAGVGSSIGVTLSLPPGRARAG
jgi:hypothetical protein